MQPTLKFHRTGGEDGDGQDKSGDDEQTHDGEDLSCQETENEAGAEIGGGEKGRGRGERDRGRGREVEREREGVREIGRESIAENKLSVVFFDVFL